MNISLPSDLESRLKNEASRHGVGAEEYARQVLIEHLPPLNGGVSLAELFAQWETEDASSDPREIARRNQETEEFKQAMNHNRKDIEGPDSRRLFP